MAAAARLDMADVKQRGEENAPERIFPSVYKSTESPILLDGALYLLYTT